MAGEGYAKGRERREEILAAAMELFAARGYRGTTIAQVAARVGISDAGLLHHFHSKEHLLVAVLAYREERDIERMRAARADSANPLEALIELCRRNAANPHIVQLFTVIAAETHSSFSTRGVYETDPKRFVFASYDEEKAPWGEHAREVWRFVRDRPWLAGCFARTGFDYRGEPTPHEWPCVNSHFGILDMCGFAKDAFYLHKAWWTDEPFIGSTVPLGVRREIPFS